MSVIKEQSMAHVQSQMLALVSVVNKLLAHSWQSKHLHISEGHWQLGMWFRKKFRALWWWWWWWLLTA